MYTLYYAPDNASLIIRLVLEELAIPYRTELVDRRINAQRSAGYLALNPAGQIPTLITPEGPISETAAILLWLADTHGRMAPRADDPARGAFLKWLFFTSNTIQANLRANFYPWRYVGDDVLAQRQLRRYIQNELSHAIGLLEDVAANQPSWLGGGEVSVLDYYLACCLRWCGLYPSEDHDWFTLTKYPCLASTLDRLQQRPAVLAAIAAEGLGEQPFTAPQVSNPPEGSAL